VGAQEDVRSLDVSVEFVVAVQVLQAHQQLTQYDHNVFLRNETRLHQIGAAATRAKLHYDPEIGALEVRTVILCDVGRVELGEDGDLLDDVVDFVFGVFDIDYLNRYRLARPFVDAFVDFAKAATADA